MVFSFFRSFQCLRALALSAATLLVASPGASAQGRLGARTLEDSIRALELARGQALLRADTTSLSRLVAEEFIEISRLGQIRSRAANMSDIATGQLKLTSVQYDSLAVRIYGDVAILTAIADNTGVFRGFSFAGRIRYMRVFVRRDGRWQAVAMQQTSMQ